MFFSIDIILATFLILCFLERKGRFTKHKEIQTVFVILFVLIPLKGATLYSMEHHLLKVLTPFAPKNHLSSTENHIKANLIWAGTLFAPIWAPYFLGVQVYREYYDPNFTDREYDTHNLTECEKSNYDFGVSDNCFQYLATLKKSKIQAERLKALELIPIARSYLNSSNTKNETVCNRMMGFADFYSDMGLEDNFFEIIKENCFKRSCYCRYASGHSIDLNIHEIKFAAEKEKEEIVASINRGTITEERRDAFLNMIQVVNINTAKTLLAKSTPEATEVAKEYLNYVLDSNVDHTVIKEQLIEARELMINIKNKEAK